MGVCQHCKVALLEPHPELQWWRKCSVCGFCEFNLDSVPSEYKHIAQNDPLAKVYHLHEKYLFRKDGQ